MSPALKRRALIRLAERALARGNMPAAVAYRAALVRLIPEPPPPVMPPMPRRSLALMALQVRP